MNSLRSYRIFGMALFDWVATLIAAALLSMWIRVPALEVLVVLLLASIFLHVVFGIRTVTNYFLGLSKMPQSGEGMHL
jgi:type IV secretory pathway VirB3-like protein